MLRYDRLVENALRGVVRDALEQVARYGLPDDHHFFVTFMTDHPGLEIPSHLRERYPEEMTIVLQYQFDDLSVLDDRFEVTLSFGGRGEHLLIPFAAITTFADPSVNFALQFQPLQDALRGEGEADSLLPTLPGDQDIATDEHGPGAEEAPASPAGKPSDNVVTLDRFRKK